MDMDKEMRLKTVEEMNLCSIPSREDCKTPEELLTYYSTKSGILMAVAEGFLRSIQISLELTDSEEVREELKNILDRNKHCLTEKE